MKHFLLSVTFQKFDSNLFSNNTCIIPVTYCFPNRVLTLLNKSNYYMQRWTTVKQTGSRNHNALHCNVHVPTDTPTASFIEKEMKVDHW